MPDFNQTLIDELRTHRGQATSGPFVGRPMLILTTTGAKTGMLRSTPLVYSHDADHLVIVASKGGAPTHPAWYHNLVAHPRVTVEVGGETNQATARVAGPVERRRLYDQHATDFPGFKDYEVRTDRVIPVITLIRKAAKAA
jgi:deazaflavin-dependent oxidoreductase (nitroreductase family)